MVDEFEGYRLEDITYCVDPESSEFFPVRIVKIGRRFLDVVAICNDKALAVAPEFESDQKNQRFTRPKLSGASRFGGADERAVNAHRRSGQELRLLPVHYWTKTGDEIIKRNTEAPEAWPMPTGAVYERWFKDASE